MPDYGPWCSVGDWVGTANRSRWSVSSQMRHSKPRDNAEETQIPQMLVGYPAGLYYFPEKHWECQDQMCSSSSRRRNRSMSSLH